MPAMIRLWHQHFHVLADDLLRGESEQPFASGIVGANGAGPVYDDNAINRCGDQGVEQIQRHMKFLKNPA